MATATDDLRRDIAALLPRLRRFARTLAGAREDADDLVQVALERALTRSAQWQPGTRLDSWLFRIMQNAWIDEWRSRQRRDATFVPEDEAHALAGATAETQHVALDVRRALAALSDEHRAVVGLVLVEGLSYQEAAGVLGIPVGTLTSRLSRAREALQAHLGAVTGATP